MYRPHWTGDTYSYCPFVCRRSDMQLHVCVYMCVPAVCTFICILVRWEFSGACDLLLLIRKWFTPSCVQEIVNVCNIRHGHARHRRLGHAHGHAMRCTFLPNRLVRYTIYIYVYICMYVCVCVKLIVRCCDVLAASLFRLFLLSLRYNDVIDVTKYCERLLNTHTYMYVYIMFVCIFR